MQAPEWTISAATVARACHGRSQPLVGLAIEHALPTKSGKSHVSGVRPVDATSGAMDRMRSLRLRPFYPERPVGRRVRPRHSMCKSVGAGVVAVQSILGMSGMPPNAVVQRWEEWQHRASASAWLQVRKAGMGWKCRLRRPRQASLRDVGPNLGGATMTTRTAHLSFPNRCAK
jgi:hypothetical protein